jgi:hypothetical protein
MDEKGRRSLVEGRKKLAIHGRRPNLARAIKQFRKDFNLSELNVEEVYRDVRDRSPGRNNQR